MMRTTLFPALLLALPLGLVACKGDTVVKIDPQTKTDLDNCTAEQKKLKDQIAQLQEENAKLMTNKATAEIVVTIENEILKVKPGQPGQVRPIDDKQTVAASQEFIDLVRKSRGSIQKCYEQALKKTTGLQSKTITLTISANFTPKGEYQAARFAPSLGDTFDNCMSAIAKKWTLKERSPVMSFSAPVSLTPS